MSGLRSCGLRMERPEAVEIKVFDADASGGRSKCMSGRQSVRTRHVSTKATIPGDMQQAEKSIRVRNAGDDLRPRLFVTAVCFQHTDAMCSHMAPRAR